VTRTNCSDGLEEFAFSVEIQTPGPRKVHLAFGVRWRGVDLGGADGLYDADREAIPDDIAALKEALAVERAKASEVEAELAIARAKAAEDSALIAQQKLRIAKLERQIYGQRSERSSRLIEQLALTFEELEADATEDELAAERAVAKTTTVRGFTRERAERQTFPEHLPRERVVIDPPTACECCGSNRLRKLGEDVTRT
jgi:transposase